MTFGTTGELNGMVDALLDDETRFWIAEEVAGDKFSRESMEYASRLFRQGKEEVESRSHLSQTDYTHTTLRTSVSSMLTRSQ